MRQRYENESHSQPKLQSFPMVYIREALLANSSEGRLAEQRDVVPDLVPTQENNANFCDEDTNFPEETNSEPTDSALRARSRRGKIF